MFTRKFLGADVESYGGKVYFSGVINSLALLLLIWIYFNTVSHEDDEAKLASALASAVQAAVGADQSGGEATVESTPPVAEDSEF